MGCRLGVTAPTVQSVRVGRPCGPSLREPPARSRGPLERTDRLRGPVAAAKEQAGSLATPPHGRPPPAPGASLSLAGPRASPSLTLPSTTAGRWSWTPRPGACRTLSRLRSADTGPSHSHRPWTRPRQRVLGDASAWTRSRAAAPLEPLELTCVPPTPALLLPGADAKPHLALIHHRKTSRQGWGGVGATRC